MSDLEKDKKGSCACKSASSCCNRSSNNVDQRLKQYIMGGVLGLVLWIVLYSYLPAFSRMVAYTFFNLKEGTHLGASVEFFFLDVPKVLMLLILVVFFVGVIRSFFTPERTRKILAGKKESVGNVLAALLGIVTPFCSCSAVPLFIGFVSAGVPLGVTFSFLISAPMVNEIALVLLYGMFGWKVAMLYLSTGLVIAILSGWVIGRLKMEKYIEEWVKNAKPPVQAEVASSEQWSERIEYGVQAVKDIVGKVWIYVVIGIAVGAGIHGYVPQEFMASIMGKDAWWSVPLAVVIGVPLYSNAAGIIPIVHALLEKGAALGTVLAFMMAVIGLSLPEVIILRKVLRPPLIAAFIGIVAIGILIVGYLFNAIF
ncbi:MAG: permease [Oligoflexia bacterium]|nr:permease [Oligoflexia bacterium]